MSQKTGHPKGAKAATTISGNRDREIEEGTAQTPASSPATRLAEGLAHSPESANLEKVRELLFGNQVRTHEQQFHDLERQLAAVKAEFAARFERLEDIVDKGFNSLTQQIQAEREARQQAVGRAGDSSRELEEAVSQKLTKLDKKVDTETQALLQEILEQSSQLTATMHEKSEMLLSELEKEVKQRRSQGQTERANLSALFGELSARLKDEG